MNYPTLDVDGGGYTAACDWLYDGNHAVFDALNTLSDALAGSGGMAGGDQSGVQWAGDYDKAAGQLLDAASQLCDAFAKAANLTNTSLSNHDAADGGSIYGDYPGEPPMPPEDKNPDHYAEGIYFDAPSAKGDTGGEPSWWHWIASHMEGWFWPNADTGRLRTIGAAWRTAGQSIQWSDIYGTGAADELSVEKSPEITVATKALNGLGTDCDTIGGAFIDLGNACDGYATMVEDNHQEIEDQLQSFLEWTAGIELAGGLFSLVTFGGAEVPAQMVEGGEVANAASKVVRLLSALLDAVKGSEVIANIVTRIEKVVPVLGRFLKAEEQAADVEKAAVEVEKTAGKAPEVLKVGDVKLPAVPKGAVGRAADNGKGVVYDIPSGTPEIDPKVTQIRIMDPITEGAHQYPDGYAVYMNKMGQTVDPLTGRVVPKNSPFAHIPLK